MSTQRGSSSQIRTCGQCRRIAGPACCFLICFTLLCLFRFETLAVPPTREQARGMWYEAIFLAETGFDYVRLMTQEPGPDLNGARNYCTSVMPTLLAVVMR